ncbi:MAG: MBL fold metallo-hydrolase [Candidatus Anammoxibacter sp.]
MKIKFWGVRGSIAVPGLNTVKYGGNTTCIEIVTDEGDRIILDSGTGIFPLGQSLLAKLPLQCSLFVTHTHWDHIQGLPFFVPLFIPNNKVNIYGAFDPVYKKSIKDVLMQQMEYCYFPVRESELKAEIQYTSLHEEQVIQVGSATVTNILMNHPVLDFGYKVECEGKKVFFSGDHEPPYNIYDPDDEFYEEYNGLINQKNQIIMDFINKVDVLILDSYYTNEEYPTKKGWGHGTFDTCIDMAKKAGVGSLYLTHHEPTRSDEDLDSIYNKILSENNQQGPKIFLAQEGLEIEI